MKFKISIGILFAIFYFIAGLAVNFHVKNFSAGISLPVVLAVENDQEKKVLEEQLTQYEKQIDEYEATIANLKKQGKSLKSEIAKFDTKIALLNSKIKALTLRLKELDGQIRETQNKITVTERDIDTNKLYLTKTLQNIYENENIGLMEMLLANLKLSDFFGDLNRLLVVQDNLKIALGKIIDLKDQLVDQKEMLAMERSDIDAVKINQDAQKTSIQRTKEEKNNILKITKGKESEYQKVLMETKKTAAEIRKQIFRLLGGGELDFEKAYELAKFAESATGVRAALILAVLDRESALGKNVGQCDYKKAMHPKRDIPIFLAIVEELGLMSNLESGLLKVSCANSDGAYGGAMGPAQFIPSTWNIYKSRITEIVGSNPPSPWKNSDAFVATALYLKDAGALNNERIAAAKYYCGAKWNRYTCTNIYGKKVVEQAARFQEDIDVLIG